MILAMTTGVVPSLAHAVTTRINPGGGPEEPANHHSWLIGHGPVGAFVGAGSRQAPDPAFDIRDDEFADMIFKDTDHRHDTAQRNALHDGTV